MKIKIPISMMGTQFLVIVTLIDIVLAVSMLSFGKRQFGGCDCSNMINHAWSLSLGYKPYHDLVTYMNPLYVLGCKWAFALWGVHFTSFVYLAVIFSLITFPLQVFLLLRLDFGKILSVLLAFAIQSMTMISISYWWYNHTTAVIACIYVTASLLLYKEPEKRFSNIVFVIAAVLLSLSKPNMAGILLVSTFLILMFTIIRIRVLSLFFIAALCSLLFLFLSGVNPVELINSYTIASGRALSRANFMMFFYYTDLWESAKTLTFLSFSALGFLLTVISAACYLLSANKISSDKLTGTGGARIVSIAIGLFCIGTGIISMGTNNDYIMTDPPLILGFFLIYMSFRELFPKPWLRKTALGLLLLSVSLFIWMGYKNQWESSSTLTYLPFLAFGFLLTVISTACYLLSGNKIFSDKLSGTGGARVLSTTLGSICIATGIIGMGTNNDHNMADAPLIVLGFSLIYASLRELFPMPWLRKTALGLLLLSIFLLAWNGYVVGWKRLRVMSVGPGMFYEDTTLTRLKEPPLFNGMYVGPKLINIIKDLNVVMKYFNYCGNPDAPVFFGTRIDFAYAMFGIHPKKGICNEVWDRFGVSRVNEKNVYIGRFIDARFKLCVFYQRDYVYIPKEILVELFTKYDVYCYGNITFHVRRD